MFLFRPNPESSRYGYSALESNDPDEQGQDRPDGPDETRAIFANEPARFLFCFVLFCFVLFCFVLFCFVKAGAFCLIDILIAVNWIKLVTRLILKKLMIPFSALWSWFESTDLRSIIKVQANSCLHNCVTSQCSTNCVNNSNKKKNKKQKNNQINVTCILIHPRVQKS